MERRRQRIAEVRVGDDEATLARRLAGGGARVNLVDTGAAPVPAGALLPLVARAREAGFQEVLLCPGPRPPAPADLAEAVRGGLDGIRATLFGHRAPVHDRIAGTAGALVRTLVAIRAVAGAGGAVEIETPLLPARLQDLGALLDLTVRAVPSLRAVRYFLYREPVPPALAPPSFAAVAGPLAEALARCRDLGIDAALGPAEAIPFCALAGHAAARKAFRFDPRRRAPLQPGCSHPTPCAACAVRAQCPGVPGSYLKAHGTAGVVPFDRRPRDLYDQRTTPRRVWTEADKAAAASTRILVLRPTVNCNQDCVFCSANETSGNVWTDPGAMLRAIARAARRGVRRVSFSGGEPTLSRHLPAFIRAARRTGIPEVELVTNGVLLDDPARVARVVDAGVTHAFVSLHAHDEALARQLTQKVDDFPRTVRAVGLLAGAGVTTVINHVITRRNYRYLAHFVAFARDRFGGEVGISFAFVTPQYKALEHLALMPRFTEVMPYLKVALLRSFELGQPAWVGSRQGVPPCQLGAFQGLSDVFDLVAEAAAEDAPQKTRAPACDACRYRGICTGVWRPYAARYGTDELKAVPGPRLDAGIMPELAPMRHGRFGTPRGFDDVPEHLRDRDDEARVAALAAGDTLESPAPEAPAPAALGRSRPLRVAMIGSGRRARRLAEALGRVPGIGLDAVASPHAPDGDLGAFGNCPAYRDAEAALDDIRPEAAVIAAATPAHRALAEACLARGIPVLLEKPLAGALDDAEALAEVARDRGGLLVPAHNVLHAPGLAEALAGRGAGGPVARVDYHRRCPAHLPDAPRTWSRASLYETLYHVLVITGRAAGGGVPAVTAVGRRGATRPEHLRLALDYAGIAADVRLDLDAPEDALSLTLTGADGTGRTWRRRDRAFELEVAGARRPVEARAGELETMVAAFRDRVLGRGPAGATPEEAVAVMAACERVLDALEADGAPFKSPTAPRHVASRALRGRA